MNLSPVARLRRIADLAAAGEPLGDLLEEAALATALPEPPPALAGLELLGASMTVAAALLGLTPYEFALWATGRGRFTAAQAVLLGLYLDHSIDQLAARLAEGNMPSAIAGAELLFEVFSQRYERGSILVTSNLPFDEWTEACGSERLTGALFDRLTHHVHILEMNGESYRLEDSRSGLKKKAR